MLIPFILYYLLNQLPSLPTYFTSLTQDFAGMERYLEILASDAGRKNACELGLINIGFPRTKERYLELIPQDTKDLMSSEHLDYVCSFIESFKVKNGYDLQEMMEFFCNGGIESSYEAHRVSGLLPV